MALFEVGRDRFHKLFSGSSSPKRVLIKDIISKGLLTDAYVQGLCNTVKLWAGERSALGACLYGS